MTVEVNPTLQRLPGSSPQESGPQNGGPQGSKGTFAIVAVGLAMVAFFIYINARSGSGGARPSEPKPTALSNPSNAPQVAGVQLATPKPVPQGTLGGAAGFTSLQGYKLVIPKGWRVLPYTGAGGTDLIIQAPGSQPRPSVFTVTVADASKRPVQDPVQELPGAETFGSFTPLPPKRITIDGVPAASQEASVVVRGSSARVLQFFVGHSKRAYNLVGICPQQDFAQRRPQIQAMVDSLRWTPPQQPAPASPKL